MYNINILTFVYLKEFQRSKAFFFLNEIKRRFQATYGHRASNAIAYSMNSEFAPILASEMVRSSLSNC